jgi:carbonic anhydrase/acetyltransferase-like protein (isoleucine patch superfamily)
MKFIHDKSNIEGDVKLGDGVSVWPFASIRGDEGPIIIGNNTSVQDNVTIHGKTTVGENVTIGHGAIVHGARVGNSIIIGMNATILDGAEIGDWSIIAAGSLVSPKTKIETGSLVMGIPGKVVRKLEEKDKQYIVEAYQNYLNKIKEKQQ